MQNQTLTKKKYRPEIDGLRAFAITTVIINHFNKSILPSGYLGVDIFFVISGYVITASLARRNSKNFWDFMGGFYERRIKRLIPALVFFVIITSILTCLFVDDPRLSLNSGVFSLLGLSNIYLFQQSTNYFAKSNELNTFAHTWSLGVEEQFYFLFPFIIWFTGFNKQTVKSTQNMFIITLILSTASLIAFISLYHENQPAAYFLIPTRFWEIATGCLVFLGHQQKNIIYQTLEKTPPTCVLCIMISILFLPTDTAIISTLLIVLLSAVLIICLREETFLYKVLTKEKIVYTGLISYSLYLWHWGVISISRWTVGIHWWSIPFQLLAIILLSNFSYKSVENTRRKSTRSRNSHLIFTLGRSCILFACITLMMFQQKPIKTVFSYINKEINKIYPPAYTTVPLAIESIYCHLPKNTKTAINDCFQINRRNSSKKNIYLIGDSHASNHYFSIKNGAQNTKFSDPFVLIDWGFIRSIESNSGCHMQESCIKDSWNKHMKIFSKNLKPGDLIIFSWARDRTVKHPNRTLPRKTDKRKINRLKSKLVELAKISQAKGAMLALVDDIPKVCTNINFDININKKGLTEMCSASEDVSKKDRAAITTVYKEITKMFKNTYYLDFHHFLCKKGICDTLSQDGKILYGDTSPHFRSDNSAPLSKEWKSFLASI